MKIKCVFLVSVIFVDIVHCQPLYRLNIDKLKQLAGINTPLNYIEDNFRVRDKLYGTKKPLDKCCVEHEEPSVRDNSEDNGEIQLSKNCFIIPSNVFYFFISETLIYMYFVKVF